MTRTRPLAHVASILLAAGALGAHADGLRIVPLLGLGATYSDNPALQPDAATRPGWIGEVTPGLRAMDHTPLLDLYADARWRILRYSTTKERDSTQGDVDARATFKVPGDVLFVDGNYQVGQQSLNAFGPASTPDRANSSANRTETRLAQAAPYARGYMGDIATWQVKAIGSNLRTDTPDVPVVNAYEFDARVRNAAPSARLGWILDGKSWHVRPKGQETAKDERLRATFLAEIAYHLRLTATVGRDDTDFLFGGPQSGNAYGGGLQWNPGPRTQATALYEHRFYGDFHDVLVAWRSPRTAWRFTSVKDLTVLPNVLQNGASTPTLQLMNDLLSSAITNPVERADAARRQLEQAAIAGAAPLSSGYITSRPVEYQEDEIAGTLMGARNAVTARADRRQQRTRGPALFPTPVTLQDDNFRQVRYSLQWTHRLTPLTSVAFEGARLDTRSLIDERRSLERQATATLQTRLGPHVALSLGVRRLLFTGTGTFSSFSENAIFGLFTIEL